MGSLDYDPHHPHCVTTLHPLRCLNVVRSTKDTRESARVELPKEKKVELPITV